MSCCTIECLGYATAVVLAVVILTWFYNYFIRKQNLGLYQTSNKDAWAVITGPTSGIGEAFALTLAKNKFNIVLIGRSADKLKTVASTIESKYSVQTKIVISDAAQCLTDDSVANVAQSLKDLKITMLVNNVGVSIEMPTTLEEHTQADITSQIIVNCLYTTRITKEIIPLIKKNITKRGAIINLSSQSAYFHVPLLSVYSATKAYNLAFSRALQVELASSKIDVTAITPGVVISAMSKVKRASLSVCSAIACATSSLDHLGLSESCGYWFHNLTVLANYLPRAVLGPILLSASKGIRAKALKKKGSETKNN